MSIGDTPPVPSISPVAHGPEFVLDPGSNPPGVRDAPRREPHRCLMCLRSLPAGGRIDLERRAGARFQGRHRFQGPLSAHMPAVIEADDANSAHVAHDDAPISLQEPPAGPLAVAQVPILSSVAAPQGPPAAAPGPPAEFPARRCAWGTVRRCARAWDPVWLRIRTEGSAPACTEFWKRKGLVCRVRL